MMIIDREVENEKLTSTYHEKDDNNDKDKISAILPNFRRRHNFKLYREMNGVNFMNDFRNSRYLKKSPLFIQRRKLYCTKQKMNKIDNLHRCIRGLKIHM